MDEMKNENIAAAQNTAQASPEPASAPCETVAAPAFDEKLEAQKRAFVKKQIKRDISLSNTVPIINMLFSSALTFILPFAAAFIYGLTVALSGGQPNDESYAYFIDTFFSGSGAIAQAVNIVIYMLMLSVGPLIYWIIRSKYKFTELIGMKKVTFSKMLYCTVFAIGISYVFNVIASMVLAFLTALGLDMTVPDFSAPESGSSLMANVLYIISLTVMPCIFEEFAYRGFTTARVRKTAPYAAILVSSLAFSLMHGTVTQIPGSLVFGLVLGYFVVRYDCIWIGVFAHFVNNLFAILPSLLSQYLPELAVNLIFSAVTVAIFVAMLCLVPVYLIRHGIKIKGDEGALSFGESMKAVFTSVGFYLMLGAAVINFITTNFGADILTFIMGIGAA
ncbi:MAG: CPBP family intramembrane metalloprotease [Clostridia bacterium]|nr:CPBP family intramembrane metalloprotease [Clostridia bacterium]